MLCAGLVEDGGAHRINAGDAGNLVLLSCLRIAHHGYTFVAQAHINTTIQLNL